MFCTRYMCRKLVSAVLVGVKLLEIFMSVNCSCVLVVADRLFGKCGQLQLGCWWL